MELRFLGTSSGSPTKTRNMTGLALKERQTRDWYLIDCAEATQHQILHTPLSLQTLRGIFITHVHGDHCYGLPGLLASAGLTGRTGPLTIVAPRAIEQFLRAVFEHTQLYVNFPVEFRAVDELGDGPVYSDLSFRVSAVALSHRVPSFAYVFDEAKVEHQLDIAILEARGIPRGPLWGALQRGQNVRTPGGEVLYAAEFLRMPRRPRRVIVGGDNDRPELLAGALREAHVLVHESTYTEAALEKVGPEPQHSSAAAVAKVAEACAVPNLVLTHFSPRYADDLLRSPSIADVAAEARELYNGRLFLAKDFDYFVLNTDGVLSIV